MGPLDLADLEELKVKQGQQRDKIENVPKDKAIQATDKAHKAGNITDREHIENLKNAPNYMQIIEDTFQTTKEGFKIGADAYTDVAKKGWGFVMDMSESMANDPAAMSEHMVETFADFQAASKGFQAGSKFGPLVAGGGAVGGVVLRRGGKELIDKVFGLLRKGDEYVDAATGMKVDPTDSTYFMSKQTERMETGFKENIDRIPKKNRATDAEFTISKVDDFAKVTKSKIKKYVDQYGGTDADVEEIFQEQIIKFQNIMSQRGARTWLNKYFKELTTGLGPDGLKNARVKNVNGELKLVDGRTKGTIKHAFDVDHHKAKEMMKKLGLEGADMHENLEIVYAAFNQRKNNIGNPAIPDDILEAIGQSTTLENFVRRKLDESFMLAGERVPQRFKESAKTGMMDAVQNMKPNETIKDIVERELSFWDKYSNLLVEIDDYVPPKVQRELDAQTNLNAIEYLEQIQRMGIYDSLTSKLKHKYTKLAAELKAEFRALSQPSSVTKQRGYGANEASKWGRFWSGRSD
tara:strand:+ start:81 stop:1643 length:1563 start_codon:yes stop_codon:yes gene_type:complete